jgi:hypothetical protein
MSNMNVLEQTYLEVHGEELLASAGLSKAQFASRMEIAPQNVKKLFATKNITTIIKVGEVLNIPLQVLIYGHRQTVPEIHGCIYINGTPNLINKKEDIEDLLKTL